MPSPQGNELERLDFKDARIEIFHTSEVVSMKESAAKTVKIQVEEKKADAGKKAA